MHFLPDVEITCDVCKGRRYNQETLDVEYTGKTIADVLAMEVGAAKIFFGNHKRIASALMLLEDVGLGYLELGRAATTLSGGEAQRIKLARELSKRSHGRTLYLLDEPTTGLHFDDVAKLVIVLQRLVDAGNTVVVIEHNVDVIAACDHVVDLGPEGGSGGGRIVAQGTPEQIARTPGSHTGRFVAKALRDAPERPAPRRPRPRHSDRGRDETAAAPAHRAAGPLRPARPATPRAREECRTRLARFAELVKSPDHLHTYRLTPLSLWNAAATGVQAEE